MHWTLRKRLFFGFGIMVGVVAVACAVGLWLATQASQRVQVLVENEAAVRVAAAEALTGKAAANGAARAFLETRDEARVEEGLEAIEGLRKALENIAQHSGDEQQALNARAALTVTDDLGTRFRELVQLVNSQGLNEDIGLQGSLRAAVRAVEEQVDQQGLAELTVLMLMARRHEKDYMLRRDLEYVDRVAARRAEFLEAMPGFGLGNDRQAELADLWETYVADFRAFVDADRQILAATAELEAIAAGLQDGVQRIADRAEAAIEGSKTDVLNQLDLTRRVLLVLFAAAILIGIVVALLTTRAVTAPVASTLRRLERIANGDLTGGETPDLSRQDDLGRMLTAVHSMRLQLVEVLTGIQQTAQHVDSAAGQVTQGNLDLSSRTQEQASSLEEVTASMEQMTHRIQTTARAAQDASAQSREARENAERGEGIATGANDAMIRIANANERVVEMLELIGDIAFQTNLLSLNAAVEAARAGEHGRGFGVVAQYVRRLAVRSAAAAKDIKAMIAESVRSVEAGQKRVEASRETLNEIALAIGEVADHIGEIAASTREQSDGIAQINQAILQMDSMTQQNAALVEQAAAASHSLGDEASALNGLAGHFKLREERAEAARRPT
ncbi:MAG: methyl-accepting chemotaxis protein [Pseudomonadota bacterium]